MKINFIRVQNEYKSIMDFYANQIAKLLDESEYENNFVCKDNMINILPHKADYFLEAIEFAQNKGININIGHGIADKNINNSDRHQLGIHAIDFHIISGNYMANKLATLQVESSKIKVFGSIKIDYLLKLQKKIPEESNCICYAPTHSRSISSYPNLLPYLKNLKREYKFIVSLHPYDDPNNKLTLDNLCKSKVVIADAGSTLYEAMALNKRVVCPDFLIKSRIAEWMPNSLEHQIYQLKANYHIKKAEQFMDIIKFAFHHKNHCTNNIINDIIEPSTRNNACNLIVDFLRRL